MNTLTKPLGALLILAASAYTAYLTSKRERKKLLLLDAWIELLFYVRGEIECYLTPRKQLLKNADSSLLQRCADSTKAPIRDWDTLLQHALPMLDEKSRSLLSRFSQELGECYREEQLRRCDHYLNSLQRVREALAQELPRAVKLGVSLRVCAALAVTILLW